MAGQSLEKSDVLGLCCTQGPLWLTTPSSFVQPHRELLLRARNDEVWKGSDKLMFHHSQGHCILMIFIQLYNMREVSPKYKIAGINEKLVRGILVEDGSFLIAFNPIISRSIKCTFIDADHLSGC